MPNRPTVPIATASGSSSKPNGVVARRRPSRLRLESLGYHPHPGQQLFHDRSERIRVIVAGRRWGKDTATLAELLRIVTQCADSPDREALLAPPRVHAWIVAPTWAHTNLPWAWLKSVVPRDLTTRLNESSRSIEIAGGILIECKSAEIPDNLVGAGLDVVVMLEAGTIASSAWDVGIRPMLASPGRWGLALVSGTPRGRTNWFYRLYKAGQDEDVKETWSMRAAMWESPLISSSEVEAMRASMSSRAFTQEIAAEFVDGQGAVFTGIAACIQRARERSGRVVCGVDWGMRNDFTALVALDETQHVVDFEKFRLIRYEQIVERVFEFCVRNRPWGVVAEVNGIGDPLFEQLEEKLTAAKIRSHPFITSSQSKTRIIERLAFAIERGNVTWPEEYAELTNELEIYELSESQVGRLSFSAPNGYHDDAVIALALANGGMESLQRKRSPETRGIRVGGLPAQPGWGRDRFALGMTR